MDYNNPPGKVFGRKALYADSVPGPLIVLFQHKID